MDKQQLRRLVSEDRLSEVFDYLTSAYEEKGGEISQQIISVANRYNKLKKDNISGVADSSEYKKIVKSLLELIENLDTDLAPKELKVATDEKDSVNEGNPLKVIGIIASILLVCFAIGLISGYSTRDYSDREFYNRYLFSKISVDTDFNDNVFLNYRCDDDVYYSYNVQTDEILERSFIDKSSNNFTPLIRIDSIMGVVALSSYFLNDDFLSFMKKPFKLKGGGNIKAKLLMIVGTLSTYSLGKWIGMRKRPKCLDEKILNRITDINFWRRYEMYTFYYIHNKDVLGQYPNTANLISYCPIDLLIDTTNLSPIYAAEIEDLFEADKHLDSIRYHIHESNYNFQAADYKYLIARNRLVKQIYNNRHYASILSEQARSWKFLRYIIFDYTEYENFNYDLYFQNYIAGAAQ